VSGLRTLKSKKPRFFQSLAARGGGNSKWWGYMVSMWSLSLGPQTLYAKYVAQMY